MNPDRIGKGFLDARKSRKIAVTFDTETFERIRNIAVGRHVSFATVARELIEWGLMDLEAKHDDR